MGLFLLGQTFTSHNSFSQATPFGVLGVVLKRTEMFVLVVEHYVRSPRIHLANLMCLGMMVTRLAWIAHRLESSNRPTKYASAAS